MNVITKMALGNAVDEVRRWAETCLGYASVHNPRERRLMLVEEAIELHQAYGGTTDELRVVTDRVYSRLPGHVVSEVGDVFNVLALLCVEQGIDLGDAVAANLTSVHARVDEIRRKRAAKKHLGLP